MFRNEEVQRWLEEIIQWRSVLIEKRYVFEYIKFSSLHIICYEVEILLSQKFEIDVLWLSK